MGKLMVLPYKGGWSVRWMKHRPPALFLNNLAGKTHGLVDYDDKVFFSKVAAKAYAAQIQNTIDILDGKIPSNKPLEFDTPPNTEGNNWIRLKKES